MRRMTVSEVGRLWGLPLRHRFDGCEDSPLVHCSGYNEYSVRPSPQSTAVGLAVRMVCTI